MVLPENKLLNLAFLTAAAASVYILESLFMRTLPFPFLRVGFSNIVILYLIYKNQAFNSIIVNVSKTLIGGLVTLTLLSPSTILSLAGGFAAIIAMLLARWLKLGLSIYGVSVIGAIAHNLIQLVLVHRILIQSDSVFMLTPYLISIGLLSGCIIAYVTLYIDEKIVVFSKE
ncbi:MAG: Gx transporter family protein [Candidatus Cloacimonetes bacterium]|nr:Gx transporter family protein [Candidatus Cloacimonadota bacterium]